MGTPAILKINVLGDARNAQRAMDSTDDSLRKMERQMRNVSAAASAFNLSIVIDQVGNMVKKASDLGETMSAVEQIFGSQADAIKAFGDTAAKSMGLSKVAALGAAKTFAVFGKGAGLADEDLTKFATGLTQTAVDMASFHNTSPEEAIQAVGSALRGENESIRKYGILLDDATLRQRAFQMGLIKTTKQALTPQQKVLAAQAEIMAQLGDAAGDQARTSDQAANTQKRLTAEWDDAQATLGELLLPYLLKAMELLEKIIPFIEDNAEIIVPLVGAIGAWAAIQGVLNFLLGVFASEIALPVLAILALIAIIFLAYKKIDGFRELVDTAFRIAKKSWDAFWKAVQEGWTKMQPQLDKLRDKFDELAKKIQPILDQAGPALEAFAKFMAGEFVAKMIVAVEVVGVMVDQISTYVGWITTLIGWIKQLISWIGKLKWPTPPKWLFGGGEGILTPSIATVTSAAGAPRSGGAGGHGAMALPPQIRIYLDGRVIRGALDRAVIKIHDAEGVQLTTGGWA